MAVTVGAGVKVGTSLNKLLQLAETTIAASATTMIIAWYFFLFVSIKIYGRGLPPSGGRGSLLLLPR